MFKTPEGLLKLAIALAVLMAGAGIGFYFGIFLPAQDVHRQAQAMADKQAAQAAADRAVADQAKRFQAAQADYQSCVDFAETSYRERWSQACAAQHEADQAAFDDCDDNLFSTRSGCLAKHPIHPALDCALPPQTAQSYAQARDARKAECATRMQSAQGVTGSGSASLRPAAAATPFPAAVTADETDSAIP